MAHVDWHWMAFGCALSAIFVALRIAKWAILTRHNALRSSPVRLTRAMLAALALGIVTPARVGEVIAVAPFGGDERPKAVLAYLYDRVAELCLVLLFSVPAALAFLGPAGIPVSVLIVVGSIAGVTLVGSPVLRGLLARLPYVQRYPRVCAVLGAPIAASPSYWAVGFIAYFVAYALVLCFIAGAEPITDWRVALVLPVVTLSNLISITVGGLGVREGLAAALSPLVGLTPEVSAAAFFLSFFWTRAVPGVIGVIWASLANRS